MHQMRLAEKAMRMKCYESEILLIQQQRKIAEGTLLYHNMPLTYTRAILEIIPRVLWCIVVCIGDSAGTARTGKKTKTKRRRRRRSADAARDLEKGAVSVIMYSVPYRRER